jgi:hypothetical protein
MYGLPRDVAEMEMKYYIAYHCDCRSWVMFNPQTVGKVQSCFFCQRRYVMDIYGEVSELPKESE